MNLPIRHQGAGIEKQERAFAELVIASVEFYGGDYLTALKVAAAGIEGARKERITQELKDGI